MTVIVLVEMQANPGDGDRLLEVLKKITPDSLAGDGAISFETVRDQDDPDKFITIGRWRDRLAHTTYMNWRAETGIGPSELAPLLANLVITYSDVVGTW